MLNVNRVILAGNLTRDPELRYTPGGSPVAHFRIAVSKKWRGKDGELKSETGFFPIVVWNQTAQNCHKFLTKGSPVLIEGRLRVDSFVGRDGNKRFITEVIGDTVSFLGGRRDQTGYQPPAQTPETENVSAGVADEGAGPADPAAPGEDEAALDASIIPF